MAPTLIPTLVYDNAPAAIDWLVAAFGFERNLIVAGAAAGTIDHAQLTLGGDMIMLSSPRENVFAMKPPRALGARTGGIYLVLPDRVDAHCARARAAGATILLEPEDKDYGGRGYSCLDPEGQLWSFGTYAPTLELAPS
ncbi:MAG TPA: VOC family protein [Gemmatimonadaceae bacterium]|nr:VOC family protein [Gemmatimonadaceae bacterium]